MFIWVRLPEGVDPPVLQKLAAQREVSFALGSDFQINRDNIPYIRLAFGFATVENIEEGISRLSACVEELLVR